MKAIHFLTFCIAGFWMISCQKEYSCENCIENNNRLPIPRAGVDQFIQYPVDSLVLDGSASIDPDGQITAYAWSVISGPSLYQFSDSLSVRSVLRNLVPGSYQVQLTVTDNNGAQAKDTLEVRVLVVQSPGSIPPVAIAGSDQSFLLPADTAILDGSSSFDTDGRIVSYEWKQLDGPAPAHIVDINNVHTLVTNLKEGTYHFVLIVTDNSGLSAADTVQCTLLPPVAPSGGFTFNLFWTCKDRCDDNDVFVTILPGFNLFTDPNIPMEVVVQDNNVWVPVLPYKNPLPSGSKYYYQVSQRTLFVYRAPLTGASSFIGKPVLVKVRFI
jgi:hypothetical protein